MRLTYREAIVVYSVVTPLPRETAKLLLDVLICSSDILLLWFGEVCHVKYISLWIVFLYIYVQ